MEIGKLFEKTIQFVKEKVKELEEEGIEYSKIEDLIEDLEKFIKENIESGTILVLYFDSLGGLSFKAIQKDKEIGFLTAGAFRDIICVGLEGLKRFGDYEIIEQYSDVVDDIELEILKYKDTLAIKYHEKTDNREVNWKFYFIFVP